MNKNFTKASELYEVPVCELISCEQTSVLCESLPSAGIDNWQEDEGTINF